MKANLQFNLDDSFEKNAHLRALNGTKAYIAIFEIMNDVFRQRIKYGNLKPPQQNLLLEMQKEVNGILDNNDINLNHLE